MTIRETIIRPESWKVSVLIPIVSIWSLYSSVSYEIVQSIQSGRTHQVVSIWSSQSKQKQEWLVKYYLVIYIYFIYSTNRLTPIHKLGRFCRRHHSWIWHIIYNRFIINQYKFTNISSMKEWLDIITIPNI